MTDYYVEEGYEEDQVGYDYYADVELDQHGGPAGPTEIEGRTSWIYLGLLGVLFLLLVLFSWACNDRSSTAGEPQTETAAEVAAGTSVSLRLEVDGGVVIVSGTVPDDAARQQLVLAAQEAYGAANVIDELQVDENVSFDGGVVAMAGSASFDDGRPEALFETIASEFGLSKGEFSIDKGDGSVDPVRLEAQLNNGSVRLVGVVPDEQSIADLTAAVEAIWGEGSADTSALTVGDSTWTDATVRVTGSKKVGDSSLEGFPAEIESRFGAAVTVDVSEVVLDQSAEALAEIQSGIADELAQQPIRFAPLSADIETESDAVLASIASRLNLVSEVQIEVIGHTDSAGDDQENLVLSQQRAEAVLTRLVELGVDGSRLTARGEGEANPIADNSTPEGREQNRRIELLLVAAG